MSRVVFALCLCLATGCRGEQRWSFSNGVGLPEGPPPRIVAEVFDAEECGLTCRPEGARRYCHELVAGAAGPAPEELESGRRYCFMGTALDEAGEAFALGCAVVEAGGGDVDITLSALDEARVIARQCETRPPVVRLDASVADAGHDAGVDAGVVDAGPVDAGLDGGPGPVSRPPSGLPDGTAIEVLVETGGAGGVFVSLADGRALGPQPLSGSTVLRIETVVGLDVVTRAVADPGHRFVAYEGGPCGTSNPCAFELDRSETIVARFEPE